MKLKRNLAVLITVALASFSLYSFSVFKWKSLSNYRAHDETSATPSNDFSNPVATSDMSIFNVLEFGARGDGQDDTEAVRRALHYASSFSSTNRACRNRLMVRRSGTSECIWCQQPAREPATRGGAARVLAASRATATRRRPSRRCAARDCDATGRWGKGPSRPAAVGGRQRALL